jgi:hypothetical protein
VSLDDLLNFLVEEVKQLMKADAVAVLLPGEGARISIFGRKRAGALIRWATAIACPTMSAAGRAA